MPLGPPILDKAFCLRVFLNFEGTDRHRDLFPVPYISAREPGQESLSQSQRRRTARFNAWVRITNKTRF